jgi:HEAT repeat protein/beta-lactamase regulating signal transducer with metallopeptidase domain
MGAIADSETGGPGISAAGLGFWLIALWFLVTAALLMRLLIGAAVASWVARTAERVDDPSWKQLTRRLARRLGISTDVELVRNEHTGMPMAWGLFRPVVLLPSDSSGWSSERRRVVLLHELAHLKRHDCQTQILAQIACAVHWFNPLVWHAARRLRAERERACDDLVLASGTKGTDYAQHLLEIARSMRSVDHAAWAAVSMAKPSQMEGRLMAILDSDRDRRSLTRVTSIAAVLLMAALVLPLAALQPWAEAAEPRALTQEEQAELQQQIQAQLQEQLQLQLDEQLSIELQQEHLQTFTAQIQQQMQEQISHQLQGLKLDEEAIEGLMSGAESLRLPASVVRSMVRKALSSPQSGETSARVVEAMISALGDEDAEIREGAAHSLGQLEDSRAVAPLSNAVVNDTEPEVREQAAWALGMIEDAAAVPALSQALTDSEADVREQAAWALGMIEDPSAIDALGQAMSDPDDAVREQVVWALGMIESEAAVRPLIDSLGDTNAEIRSQAAWALGMIEDASAVDALAGALQDTNSEVREHAAWALGMIEDEEAVSALGTALNDSEASVREQAAWALGMIEDATAVDSLAAALASDVEPAVREQAAWALGMIEDARALDALLDALENDTEKDVREMALWAIGRVSDDVWQEDSGYEAPDSASERG